jgi:ferredoxin
VGKVPPLPTAYAKGCGPYSEYMPTIRVVDKDVEVPTQGADPILFVLLDNRVTITSICGGNMSCGTCNIEVVEGMENLNPPSDDEQRVLSRIKRQGPNVRLACQCVPTGDVAIQIVPDE